MTLQNAGINRLIDRIVNLIGSEIESENDVNEGPARTVTKKMKNAWDTIRFAGLTVLVGDNLTVEISDNGEYRAKVGNTLITCGYLLDCQDGYGNKKVRGGRESAQVFLAHDYEKYSIQILSGSVYITGQDSDFNDGTMKWSCSK